MTMTQTFSLIVYITALHTMIVLCRPCTPTAETLATERLPRCEYFSLHNDSVVTVTCNETYISEVADFVKDIVPVNYGIAAITIDCHGYNSLTLNRLIETIRGFNLTTAVNLSIFDCYINVNEESNDLFDGIKFKLSALSFACNDIALPSGGSVTKFFQAIAALEMLDSFDFYSNYVHYDSYREDKMIDGSPFDIRNAKRCHYSTLLEPCFCTEDVGKLVVLHCPRMSYESFVHRMQEHSNTSYALIIYSFDPNNLLELINCPYVDTETLKSPTKIDIRHCDDVTLWQHSASCLFDLFFKLPSLANVAVHKCGLKFNQTYISNVRSPTLQLSGVVSLGVSYNNMETFESELVAPWSNNLISLNLSHNDIQILDNDSFASLSQLETLDLSNNKINFIDPHTFLRVTNLQMLMLGFNNLQSIDRQWFVNLHKLKHLDLTFNSFETLTGHGFLDAISLTYLAISNKNGGLEIDGETFAGLQYLKTLIVGSVAKLQSNSFAGLHSLENLEIVQAASESTLIDDITNNSLQQLTSLRHLEIKTGDGSSLVFAAPCSIFTWTPLLNQLHMSHMLRCNWEFVKWLQLKMALQSNFSINLDATFCTDSKTYEITSLRQALNNEKLRNVTLKSIDSREISYNEPRDILKHSFYETLNYKAKQSPVQVHLKNKRQAVGSVIGLSIAAAILIAAVFAILLNRSYRKKKKQAAQPENAMASQETKESSVKTQSEHIVSNAHCTACLFMAGNASIFAKVLWGLCTACLSALLIRDIGLLAVQFQYDRITAVTVVRDAHFVQQPFTICMPTAPLQLRLTENELREILYGEFEPCSKPKQYPLQLSLYRSLLLHASSYQFAWEGGLIPEDSNYAKLAASERRTTAMLSQYIETNKFSQRELLSKISQAMCTEMNISAMITTPRGKKFEQNVLYSDICQQMTTDDYGLTFYDDVFSMTACFRFPQISFNDKSAIAKLTMKTLHRINESIFHIDLGGHPFSKSAMQDSMPLELRTGAENIIGLRLRNVAHSMTFDRTGARRCYKDCVGTVRVQRIQQMCGCRPLMWSKLDDSYAFLPDCTLQKYQACNLSMWNNFDEECEFATPCDYYQYDIEVTHKKLDTLHKTSDIVVQFNLTNSMYIVMEESPSMTSSVFLSNIGGAFALWLGSIFIIIACLIVFCFDPLMGKLRQLPLTV